MSLTLAQFAPLVELVGQIDSDLAPYTNTIGEIFVDPALPEVVDLIGQIAATYPSSTPGAPNPYATPGVGLSSAVLPLQTFLYGRRHWWFLPLAGLTLLAIPVLVGVGIGRRYPRDEK